jgi:putative aldouronate transport system permease protein
MKANKKIEKGVVGTYKFTEKTAVGAYKSIESQFRGQSPEGQLADILMYGVLIIVMLVALIPMWHTLMASLSEGQQLIAHDGIAWLWVTPDGKPHFEGYEKTFSYGDFAILKSYVITLLYVVGNVVFGLIINVIGAYVIYRQPKLAGLLMMIVVFTLLFSGGMIPTYMVIKDLGMTGTPWSLIIPGCSNAMFMILVLNGFKQVPVSTVESSELDGAGHFTVMFKILLPQAKGLTIVTMINTAILAWNSWFEASIYVPQNRELWPIQLWIKQIVGDNASTLTTAVVDWNRYLVAYCVILIATLPVLAAMPFVQKQLQKGALLGAVKE